MAAVTSPYPSELLQEGETALALFAAAFKGWNDSIHFVRAGMTATCVDIDDAKLRLMEEDYPANWRFVNDDAWEFALDAQKHGDQWDVVSVDTFTGSALERSLKTLGLWCSLARRVVIVTIMADSVYTVPAGWEHYEMARTDTVSWLVMTR